MKEMTKTSRFGSRRGIAHHAALERQTQLVAAKVPLRTPVKLDDRIEEGELSADDFVGLVLVLAELIEKVSRVASVRQELCDDLGCLSYCLRRTVKGDQ